MRFLSGWQFEGYEDRLMDRTGVQGAMHCASSLVTILFSGGSKIEHILLHVKEEIKATAESIKSNEVRFLKQ